MKTSRIFTTAVAALTVVGAGAVFAQTTTGTPEAANKPSSAVTPARPTMPNTPAPATPAMQPMQATPNQTSTGTPEAANKPSSDVTPARPKMQNKAAKKPKVTRAPAPKPVQN